MEATTLSAGNIVQFARRVLIIAQGQTVPSDSRAWQVATELHKNGCIVSVICPRAKGFETSVEEIDGIHIFRHPPAFQAKSSFGFIMEYAGSVLWQMMLTYRVFFTVGFDVVHACNPPDSVFLTGGFFKTFFSKKYLFDFNSPNPERFSSGTSRKGMMAKMALWFERMNFRIADIAIAANESCHDIAAGRGKMAPEKLFLVRSAPNLERIKAVPPVPSLKEGRKYLVGYCGTMGRPGGVQYLIEAARIIVQDMKREDIHFVLTGDGAELAGYIKLARLQGVSEYMTFTGAAPGSEILGVLSTSDICVNVDEVNAMTARTSAINIAQYMALGKPVVQFETTEGRITAGDASLYAEPNDAGDLAQKIVSLLDDPAQRSAMGEMGRAGIVNELNWRLEAPKLLAAYDALFKEDKKDTAAGNDIIES